MLKHGVTWREFNEFAAKILIEGLYQLGLIKVMKNTANTIITQLDIS